MRKLIYVDDDTMNLSVFEIQFEPYFEIVTCSDPLQAQEIVRNELFPVLVTDYRMPKLNGMDLIRNVKSELPDTQCILLSGYNKSELSLDSDLIFDYFSKPLDFQKLLGAIKNAFDMKGLSVAKEDA